MSIMNVVFACCIRIYGTYSTVRYTINSQYTTWQDGFLQEARKIQYERDYRGIDSMREAKERQCDLDRRM